MRRGTAEEVLVKSKMKWVQARGDVGCKVRIRVKVGVAIHSDGGARVKVGMDILVELELSMIRTEEQRNENVSTRTS